VSTVPPIDQQQIESALVRINARAWGVAMGLLLGLGLFLATVILLIRGGPNMGQHLQLISVFFPGYSVSWLGSVVGFIYAFVVGYGLGRVIGVVYNRLSTPS
jgi:hypothetical protein